MIKVVGTWDFGWSTPIMEFDLWHFPLRDFGIDEWIMWPISGIDKRGKVIERSTLATVIEENPDLTPVYVDDYGETPLQSFVHPENVLYILGKASFSPFNANNKEGISVKIETPGEKGGFWPHQAISIVLYDRFIKNGSYSN